MTAASRPSRTSRLPAATSPWNQTGGPRQVAARAASHARRDGVARDPPPSARSPASVSSVVVRQRAAAEEVVRRRRRAVGGVDRLAARRGSPRASSANAGRSATRSIARGLALEPAVDRPARTDNPPPGAPCATGAGIGSGQVRREPRQPALLLVDLRRVPLAARQPHRHLVAEPEGAVVPAVEFDRRATGRSAHSRELAVDQAADESRVDATSAAAALADLRRQRHLRLA